MKGNLKNVFVIAQKEFADSIWSPRFYVILGIFMSSLILNGYQAGRNVTGPGMLIISPLTMGFMGFATDLSILGSMIAIVLGFDAIIKERKSGSLNVLLTHPVYRDQIITGKLLGMMVTLGFVVIVSVGAATGLMLGVSGIAISFEVINRIMVFMILAFLFMLSYLAFSILVSTFSKEPADSLVYCIAGWLVMGTLLILIANTVAGFMVGEQKMFEEIKNSSPGENTEKMNKITQIIMSLSPATHLKELVQGKPSMQFDPESTAKNSEMQGLFDTGFTLDYWVSQNWVNLIILIIIPVILLFISYMAFMKQDITL
jgi:ABC-2 type transport system permease protein